MARSISNTAVALSAAFALFGASNAMAADTAELSLAKDTATASAGPASAATGLSSSVLSVNNRETNLQKTPTSILVMGIEGKAKRRVQR